MANTHVSVNKLCSSTRVNKNDAGKDVTHTEFEKRGHFVHCKLLQYYFKAWHSTRLYMYPIVQSLYFMQAGGLGCVE